ncbi:nicotinate phosphoribosyltransferase [Neoroseomonas eburnea]|uniref:nicotinate phosphoribosyltransferase n=1 Tax=Neoroseomonas eburnea TaxID=1346889 RepID=UPI0030B9FD99
MSADGLELFADLYEFRMAHAYHALGMEEEAVFSLFVRRLPAGRNFLLACGAEDFCDTLEALRFGGDSLAYLRGLGAFPEEFLAWLARLRFSGAVHAVPEGTPVFAGEPLIEVVAPIAEAQLLETLAMNMVGLQTLLASKAARVVAAAAGRPVVEFGSRRAQGIDAALAGARAFHLAGVAATSNVLAGARHGIPVAGTMAHSFVQAFAREADAFRAFAHHYPETILLVDTYDTAAGVRRVVELARELGAAFRVRGIRLDSGDLAALARQARGILDHAGLTQVQIFASGGLDEHRIAALLAAGAPIDAFGVGTEMSVSGDAPALDIAYKLTAYAGQGRMKLSEGKRTLPGRKQVFRTATGDTVALAGEDLPGEPLLRQVMAGGRRAAPRPPLATSRQNAAERIAALPAPLRALAPATPPYPVAISPALAAEEGQVRARLSAANLPPRPVG